MMSEKITPDSESVPVFHDVLTPEEAAEYLRVDRETIYRRLRAGQLPGNKVGGQWRLLKQELVRFLKGPAVAR